MQGQERIHLHTQHHKTGRPVMCKLRFFGSTNNHDNPGIQPCRMKQITITRQLKRQLKMRSILKTGHLADYL